VAVRKVDRIRSSKVWKIFYARSGLSLRMLSKIELGDASPSLMSVAKIAHALGTDFTTLATEPRTDERLQAFESSLDE
jgi:transcriptional regulator with XRE-family HTH domain